MVRSRLARGGGLRTALAAAAALALFLPAAAVAAPKSGTSNVTFRLIESCVFEATYSWSGFGSVGTEATGAVSMFLREPGSTDELMTFSSYSFPSSQTLRSGTFTYRFGDMRTYQYTSPPSADARFVFVGQLIQQKRHYGTLVIEAARAETVTTIPAACLP